MLIVNQNKPVLGRRNVVTMDSSASDESQLIVSSHWFSCVSDQIFKQVWTSSTTPWHPTSHEGQPTQSYQ
jgi:hypothetical protein